MHVLARVFWLAQMAYPKKYRPKMVIQMWNPLSEGGVVDSDSHNCWFKTFSEKESAEREDKKKWEKKKK